MSTTAQWVFEKAVYLMDEQNESNGRTQTTDTKEYEYRTLAILNVLRHELYPISDTYRLGPEGKRAVCPEVTAFTDEIGLDDAVAQGVMPYGLAAHLLVGENDAMANYFSQRYLEAFRTMGGTAPSAFEDIPRAYGGLSC